MANLPWEAPSYWVRPNKTADDIGKTYGVIYINNVNRNFKNNAAYALCIIIPKTIYQRFASWFVERFPKVKITCTCMQIQEINKDHTCIPVPLYCRYLYRLACDYFHNRHFIMKRVKHLHFLKIWDILFISLTDILPIAMSSWLGYIL